MTLLAISFHSIHMSAIRSLWAARDLSQARIAPDAHTEHLPPPLLYQREPYASGAFVLYDWERDEILWQLACDGASGFCWRDGLLYLTMLRMDEVLALDGHGCEQFRFSHPHLNNIHTLQPTKQGFLLTSSGTDAIIELDQHGILLYEWSALEHGYAYLKNGKVRTIDYTLDQRHIFYSTPLHTTHVNSARYADESEEKILATLFSQGEVIEIDKQSGDARTLVSGLQQPHDLRPCQDGWTVADTRNNRVVLLDKDWNIKEYILMEFDWVQDATMLHDHSIVVADTNKHRLVRVYQDKNHQIRSFPNEWRIFQVEEVPTSYQNFFAYPHASQL